MKKNALRISLGLILAVGNLSVRAALLPDSTLTIENGSEFTMEITQNYPLHIPISGRAGLALGTAQATGASHSGLPTGAEVIATSIDNGWAFLSQTGLDFTAKAITVIAASGNTATLDFSGWRVSWNGVASINMGGGNQSGVANVTFGRDGGNGDSYSLVYTATVPYDGQTPFGGVKYGLHLTGHVASGPAIDAVSSNLTAVVGQPFGYKVTALDPNDDTYVWSAAPLPAGAKFTSATWDPETQKWGATLAWTPTPDQTGHFPIAFSVQDSQTGLISAQSTSIDVVDFVKSNKPFDAGDPVKAISISLARFDQASSKLFVKGSVSLKKAKNKAAGKIVDIIDRSGALIGNATIRANNTWSLCTRLTAAPAKNTPFGAEHNGLVDVRKATLAKKLRNPCA